MSKFTKTECTTKFGNIFVDLYRDGEFNARYNAEDGQNRDAFLLSIKEDVAKQSCGQIVVSSKVLRSGETVVFFEL